MMVTPLTAVRQERYAGSVDASKIRFPKSLNCASRQALVGLQALVVAPPSRRCRRVAPVKGAKTRISAQHFI